MPAYHDASDFIDSDFQSAQQTAYTAPLPASPAGAPPASNRPPTREEIESLVSQKQIKLAELKRAQEDLERERASLEELRRRQMEFQAGRAEMLQNLTRGLGLLEEAELTARRDADQMARALGELREAVTKVQGINEQLWNQENYSVELTRALTTLENARMEWNSARMKFPLLAGNHAAEPEAAAPKVTPPSLASASLWQLGKIGLAVTWPIWLVGLAIFVALLLRR